MFQQSGIHKSQHPCPVCAKRKVKCDRLIPCSNCVKRGFEKECVQRSNGVQSGAADPITGLLRFWQNYEYWITNIGLYKCQDNDLRGGSFDLNENLDECEYWCNFLTREQSFQLLDFSMERLGALYFGCISDISELYLALEEYWQRRDEENGDLLVFSIDDHYWDAVLWSIFSLAVYYMPLERLNTILTTKPVHRLFALDDQESGTWTEALQSSLVQCFNDCTITQLYKTNFFANPDIRLIQVYLILSNTTYPQQHISSSDSLLLHCFHVAKIKHVNDFKPLVNDSTSLRIAKITCEKIWYQLCTCDYLQSGPNKPVVFHTEMSSLMQHAAYLEDLPNIDVYQSEDYFEVLYWKILSLDRDLDQYLTKQSKPPLKTLDAIQRQTEIFNQKIASPEETPSLSSDFAKFLVSFLLQTICWKLNKMYFIYYDVPDGLIKSVYHAKSLIALVVRNIKRRKDSLFNKHPIVLRSFSRIAPFYAFYQIFAHSPEIESLNLDIKEVLQYFPNVLESQLINLHFLLSRFESLKKLWESVKVVDAKDLLMHPVLRILQNDVDVISRRLSIRPSLIRGVAPIMSTRTVGLEEDEGKESQSFRLLVAEFEAQHAIDYIIRPNKRS